MKKPYIRSIKGGRLCQTEITWGQWLGNRMVAAWSWLRVVPAGVVVGKRGHF